MKNTTYGVLFIGIISAIFVLANPGSSFPQAKGGHFEKEVKYVAGKDKKWLTNDDEVYLCYLTEFDGKGRMIRKSTYKTGNDHRAFTADDELQDYQIYDYTPDNKMMVENFFNSQNIVQSGSVYAYDALGRKESYIRLSPKNAVLRKITYSYDPKGLLVKDVEYTSPGADGQWASTDQGIEKYHQFYYDQEGKLIKMTEYHIDHNGPGPDGKWFTEDDMVSSTKEFIYDKSGRKILEKKCIATGPDGKWFTDDDQLQYYTKFLYEK